MDNNSDNLKKFIKEKLDILDKSKLKYTDYINSKHVYLDDIQNQFIIKEKGEIVFSKRLTYLGIFNIISKVWIWSWCIPTIKCDFSKDARRILDYGLQLEPSTNTNIHYYIKPHLVNSRVFFENDILLDIHLGLSIYISKALFIYSLPDGNNVCYYLIF